MHRTIGLLAVVLTVGVSDANAAESSNADPPLCGAAPGPIGQWRDYRVCRTVRTFAAGDYCSFAVKSEVVVDEERIRTLAVDASGKPLVEQFTGPLVFRFTNTATGKSALGDVSGDADAFHHPDGRDTWILHDGFFLNVSKYVTTNVPPGLYVLSGGSIFEVADRTHFRITPLGKMENMCETLAN
ncbi:hypothetical protein LVJ94_06845 [Pendulispora rubella]|uniref:Uncharacterized protein n=1 Tax=Pendulispora rubella TaxID=2741070 RepID=A0ABZ2L7P1_9BACT